MVATKAINWMELSTATHCLLPPPTATNSSFRTALAAFSPFVFLATFFLEAFALYNRQGKRQCELVRGGFTFAFLV
jgi:hypothetical protein